MTAILLQSSYLGAIGFCFCTLGWLVFKGERNRITSALVACQILIIIWCVPQLFLAFADSRRMKYILYGISYIGISFIGPCWFMFSFLYCGKEIPAWAGFGMFCISLLDYGMFLSNGLHNLFYRSFELSQVIYGPMFYFHMIYTYICVILGMAAVFGNFIKDHGNRIHGAFIILAAAVPLGFNMLYLSGVVSSGFDLTPPVFALSSFLLLLAVFRYDFLDVNVTISRQIFAAVGEGIIIYNRRGKVTCCNDAACRYVEVKNGDSYENVRKRLLEIPSRRNKEPEGIREESIKNGMVLELPGEKKVQIKQYEIRDRRGQEKAGVLILTDVGEYYELLRQSRELAVSEQRLAIEQERNRIAQEVHDTTGHTLTMIQSLVKLIRIRCEEKRDVENEADLQVMEYLSQAQELACEGIRELRQSINHMRWGCGAQLVTQGVYQLAGSVREMEVQVEIQGEDGPEYSHLSRIVYQCLREAVTNCLKYAHAGHMDVILKFGGSSVSVYIFDNGQGCSFIEEHNGLSGIRERVSTAGGQVRFLSAEGEGFQIFFELPLAESSNPYQT